MGVNVGDVIVEQHDIFGDGVNAAAHIGEGQHGDA
jgi:class 3 adenylate cyclase